MNEYRKHYIHSNNIDEKLNYSTNLNCRQRIDISDEERNTNFPSPPRSQNRKDTIAHNFTPKNNKSKNAASDFQSQPEDLLNSQIDSEKYSHQNPNSSDSNFYSSPSRDNSSATEIFASQIKLKAELNSAYQMNKQLKDQNDFLETKLSELNNQADITLRVLDERKRILIEENKNLKDILAAYPSEEELQAELQLAKKWPEELVNELIKMSIMQSGDTSDMIIQRLNEMIEELQSYERSLSFHCNDSMDNAFSKYFISEFIKDEKQLKNELLHKINILRTSSESNHKIALKKANDLEREIDRLTRELEESPFKPTLEEMWKSQTFSPSISPSLQQTGQFALHDIERIAISAGYKQNSIEQVDQTTFVYRNDEKQKEISFEVVAICGRPYIIESNIKVPLLKYLKSIK